MYNATEQFVELNKANVAQASKIAAITLGNAEKLMNLNLSAAKSALAQSIENAQAAASVKDVQELFTLRARLAESGVQTALAYSRTFYELASEAQAEFTARLGRDVGELQQGRRDLGRHGVEVRAGRLGRRRQRVQVDVRRDDRCVRPVPEGDEAGREPRRRERPCSGRLGRQGRAGQGSQGRVSTVTASRVARRGRALETSDRAVPSIRSDSFCIRLLLLMDTACKAPVMPGLFFALSVDVRAAMNRRTEGINGLVSARHRTSGARDNATCRRMRARPHPPRNARFPCGARLYPDPPPTAIQTPSPGLMPGLFLWAMKRRPRRPSDAVRRTTRVVSCRDLRAAPGPPRSPACISPDEKRAALTLRRSEPADAFCIEAPRTCAARR